MKKKWNSVAIIAIVGLLAIGSFIPMGIMWIEDMNLKRVQSQVEVEPIQLNSQTVDVIEELSIFADMLSNYLVVEVDANISGDYDEHLAMQEEIQQVEDSELELSGSKELYRTIQDFLTMLDVKEELVLEQMQATNYAMMVEKNDERVYSIWECKGHDETGNGYYFWLDATTGKVMAFDVPYQVIGHYDEAFYSTIHRLSEYYEFEKYGFPVYSFAETQSNLYKTKYWKNEIFVLDENLTEQLSICVYKEGERLLFNMHPK